MGVAGFTEFFGGRVAEEFEDGTGIQISPGMPWQCFLYRSSIPTQSKRKSLLVVFSSLKVTAGSM